MLIIELNSTQLPDQAALDQACTILTKGGIIGYPTDTLYGLGVDARNAVALENLYTLKHRKRIPMSIMLDSVEALLETIQNLSPTGEKLIQAFLPGPLTLVCKADLEAALGVTSKTGLIGLRVPDHKLSLALVKTLGRPITSTSANLSGYPSALNIETIIAYFNDRVDLVFDQGTLHHSPGSTVIDISQRPFRIIREGAIASYKLWPYLK